MGRVRQVRREWIPVKDSHRVIEMTAYAVWCDDTQSRVCEGFSSLESAQRLADYLNRKAHVADGAGEK